MKPTQSMHIAEIRQLASQYSANAIENCIQLALANQDNPCYASDEASEVMNVLAKASYVKDLVQKGMTLSEAIRELGRRIRAIQGG